MNEFIAYDKENKEWVNPNDVYVNGNSIVYRIKYHSRPTPMDSVREYLKAEKVSIYPYIGRTDRDGKKIYEGSLVKWLEGVYEIYFDEDSLQYLGRNTNIFKRVIGISTLAQELTLIIGHIAEGNHAD